MLVSRAGGLVVDAGVLLAIAASLAATFCYASGGVWLKRYGSGLSPYAVAAWSQLLAGVALLPLGATSPPLVDRRGGVANLLRSRWSAAPSRTSSTTG